MKNNFEQNNVQIFGILRNVHLKEFVFITLVTSIILAIIVSFYVFNKKWINMYNSLPAFQLDLNNISE